MMRLATIALAVLAGAAPLAADFSYKTDMKVTGGAMAGAMRMATRMSKTARSAMEGATYIKGSKMAMQTGDSITVMDLDAETVTTIDHSKNQYSVLTFAEYQQAVEQLAQKARGKKDDVDVKYAVRIKDGGKKQNVYGFPASLTIFTLEVDASDSKGQKASVDMVNDMWFSKEIAGADEMSAFSKRMAEKMSGFGAQNMGAMGAMIQQQGGAQALKEFQENAARLEGVPVLTVIRVGQSGTAGVMTAKAGKLPEENGDAEASSRPSVGGMLRGMGGLGGRRGGQPQAESPAAGAESLIEMAMKAYDFSTAPIADSQFAIPAGYKEVESDLKKALR